MESCSAIKSVGKKKEGMLGMTVFVFPSNHLHTMGAAFLEMTEQLPADPKQGMNFLFYFACVHSFCFLS